MTLIIMTARIAFLKNTRNWRGMGYVKSIINVNTEGIILDKPGAKEIDSYAHAHMVPVVVNLKATTDIYMFLQITARLITDRTFCDYFTFT